LWEPNRRGEVRGSIVREIAGARSC
jgi:hypothetical protein